MLSRYSRSFLAVNKQVLKPRNQFITRSYASEGEHAASGSFLNRQDVTERVINVLKKHDKVDASKVTPDSHFVKDLGLDSLDSAEIVNEVEQEFVVEIPDEEAFKLQSVGDVVNYIATSPVAK